MPSVPACPQVACRTRRIGTPAVLLIEYIYDVYMRELVEEGLI
jgi:hypothetical protein